MNETVDGLMLMGHHAKAGTPNAFLPHTENTDWADFSINGQSVGEIGIETCFAGHWGVPLILAQGDEAMCKEVQAQFPGAVTACVKRAESFDRCTGPDAAGRPQVDGGESGRGDPEAAYRQTCAVQADVAHARRPPVQVGEPPPKRPRRNPACGAPTRTPSSVK